MRAKDTTPEAHEIQLEAYRRMTGEQRVAIGLELTRVSRELLKEGIRRRHPGYSAEEVRWGLIRIWLGPELFARVYPDAPQVDP